MTRLADAIPKAAQTDLIRKDGIRTILVRVCGDSSDAFALAESAELARLFGANLDVLFVHADPENLAEAIGAFDPLSSAAIGGIIDDCMRESDAQQAKAKQAFEVARHSAGLATDARTHQPRAEWLLACGDEADCLVSCSRGADLLVMVRCGKPGQPPSPLLEAALFKSGKPLLLLPLGIHRRLCRTVAIAWKDTSEAARAITAALPFIQGAEQVLLMTAAERNAADDLSAYRVMTALTRHNPLTALVRVPSGDAAPADRLFHEARDRDVDVLVMGAYGHSRIREMIFGGFTDTALRQAPLPLLLSH
jgi:nucleotide-binding universal stress UspA family protein